MGLYKRKQRDGSLSETWAARFRYRLRRVDENTFEATKEKARQWIRDKKKEIDKEAGSRPSLRRNERLTLQTAADRYVEEHLQNQVGARSEMYRLQQIINDLGPDLPLEELTTAHIKALVARRMAAGGVAAITANRDRNPIRALHNMARDVWEYPVKAIAWKKTTVKAPKRIIKFPLPEEVKLLVANAVKPRLARVIMFAALTGFRLDEIRELQWTDLQMIEGTMWVTSIGKGDKEVALPLSSATTSLILSIPRGTSSRVFDLGSFGREWAATRDKAGLRRIRFHDLKHAFATLLRQSLKQTHGKVDPFMLKEATRHADLATLSIYAHVDNVELLPSLEQVGAKLSGSLKLLQSLSTAESGQPDAASTEQLDLDFGLPSASPDPSSQP